MNLIIANIIALVASLLMLYSGIIKRKKKIIYIQTIQMGLSVISNIILGGITGAIMSALGCIRNILCYKGQLNFRAKMLLIVSATILSLMFNNLGFVGILPLISSVVYILLITVKKVIKLKLVIIFTMLMWFIYDVYIMSYSSAIFDYLNIIFNVISIFQLKFKQVHKTARKEGSCV